MQIAELNNEKYAVSFNSDMELATFLNLAHDADFIWKSGRNAKEFTGVFFPKWCVLVQNGHMTQLDRVTLIHEEYTIIPSTDIT